MSSKQGLTIWIDTDLVEAVEEYAQRHHTTLQALISELLRQIAIAQSETPPSTVLDRLAGILPPEASTSEHGESLAKKYLDPQ